MRVRCHDEAARADVEGGLIVALGQEGVGEMPMKQAADEFRGGAAAAAMHHLDRAIEQGSLARCEAGIDHSHAAASAGAGCRKRP